MQTYIAHSSNKDIILLIILTDTLYRFLYKTKNCEFVFFVYIYFCYCNLKFGLSIVIIYYYFWKWKQPQLGNLAFSFCNCSCQVKLQDESSPCEIFGNTVNEEKIMVEYFVFLSPLLILVFLSICICHSFGKI